jgi:hypothetical protein
MHGQGRFILRFRLTNVMPCRCRSALVSHSLEQEDDDVSQPRHHLRPGTRTDPAGVRAERPITDPMQAILTPPPILQDSP